MKLKDFFCKACSCRSETIHHIWSPHLARYAREVIGCGCGCHKEKVTKENSQVVYQLREVN